MNLGLFSRTAAATTTQDVNNDPSTPLLLTVDEACESLHISRPTLYGLITDGSIRSIKIGRARRIPLEALERFIEAALSEGEEGWDEFLPGNDPSRMLGVIGRLEEGILDLRGGLPSRRPPRSKAFLDGDRLDIVRAETTQWLWKGYVPLGALTYVDGMPGVGKTTVSLDLASRVSRGSSMPDGPFSDLEGSRTVLLAEGEDALGETIKPRLQAAGADMARIISLTEIAGGRRGPEAREPWSIPDHLRELEERIAAERAALVIVDPLISFLSAGIGFTKDQDVRRALDPLAAIAQRQNCAIVLLRHPTKGNGSSAVYRGAGSSDQCLLSIGTSAHIVALWARRNYPDSRGARETFLPDPQRSSSRIEASDEFKSSTITWGKTRNVTADELLAEQENVEDVSTREQIAELLLDLTEHRPLKSVSPERT